MNKVILIGNVGNEIETFKFDNGNQIGKLSLATNTKFTNKQTGEIVTQTTWHNLKFYNKACDIVEKFVSKGDKLAISGSLKVENWENKDKVKMTSYFIQVDEFKMLTPKGEK